MHKPRLIFAKELTVTAIGRKLYRETTHEARGLFELSFRAHPLRRSSCARNACQFQQTPQRICSQKADKECDYQTAHWRL